MCKYSLLFIVWLVCVMEVSGQLRSMKELSDDLLVQSLKTYQEQLNQFRSEFGGIYPLPKQDFFLFGMGNRDKFVYKNGQLYNSKTGQLIYSWQVKEEKIVPNQYAVILYLRDGNMILIYEDSNGIWLKEADRLLQINQQFIFINLPDFEGNQFNEILKVLHQEILINIVDSNPLPNYFVYKKPWRRDAAMMAMCLSHTGNLQLIHDWVLSLKEPYDYNNGKKQGSPESETDNLGQTLYLISLFSDRSFPLVSVILEEMKKWEKLESGVRYLSGRSDFQEVPVYQTKWIKFGLKALNLDDPYSIPAIPDNYSSLFWWNYGTEHIPGDEWRNANYPYIGWARDHFYDQKNGLISDRLYPLTWEKDASQADYEGMDLIHPEYVDQKIAAPHTWHASEIFLYLLDLSIN